MKKVSKTSKLIKKLPDSVIEQELPLLLGTVCTTLKSRDQDVRDGARGALAKISTELGPSKLPEILSALETSLCEVTLLLIFGDSLLIQISSVCEVVLSFILDDSLLIQIFSL